MKKIILDINVVRAVLSADFKTAEVYNCILDKKNDFCVVICDSIEKMYFDHLQKWSLGFNRYYQHFKQNLERQKQILEFHASNAPYKFSHKNDQGIIDCAHSTNCDIIVTSDSNFKSFKHDMFHYECLTPKEFLEKYCLNYI